MMKNAIKIQDDNNNRNSMDVLKDINPLLPPLVKAGKRINEIVKENEKVVCFFCKEIYRKKELTSLKICWESKTIAKNHSEYSVPDENCYSIKLKSNWPTEYIVPDDFRQECDIYYGKEVCANCAKNIGKDLIKHAHTLVEYIGDQLERLEKSKREELEKNKREELERLEKSKICCPRCNARFLPIELSRVNSRRLPWYWVFESFFDVEICENCGDEVFIFEYNRYQRAKEKSAKIKTYSANYKGKIGVDFSTTKSNIESDTYRDRDDALSELCLRAFLEGFDVVYDYKWNKKTDYEYADTGYNTSINYVRGIYRYSVWSVTGSFANFNKK